MTEETSVKDLLKELIRQNEQLVNQKEAKQWRLPFKARVSNNAIKRGYATVILLKNNGTMDFLKAPVDGDGCMDIEGFPRIATAEHRMTYKNKPIYIIPEWSMRPISLVETMASDEQDKMNIAGRRLILARLQREQIKPTKKLKGGLIGWIILGAVIIGAIYYLSSGGSLF